VSWSSRAAAAQVHEAAAGELRRLVRHHRLAVVATRHDLLPASGFGGSGAGPEQLWAHREVRPEPWQGLVGCAHRPPREPLTGTCRAWQRAAQAMQGLVTEPQGAARKLPEPKWYTAQMLPKPWQDLVTHRLLLRRLPAAGGGGGAARFGCAWLGAAAAAPLVFTVTEACVMSAWACGGGWAPARGPRAAARALAGPVMYRLLLLHLFGSAWSGAERVYQHV